MPKTVRPFATAPPPHQGDHKPKQNNNTALLIATGTAAVAGIYWYLTRPESVKHLKEEVKREEADVFTKAKELGDTSRIRTQEMLSQGREKYADAKVCHFSVIPWLW